MSEPWLALRGLSAWYGQAQALREVSLEVGRGELVTLVGRNGAGKSTLLRSIMGLHPQSTGEIRLGGVDLTRRPPDERARQGLGYVPDDRGVYASLTVEENLLLPPRVGRSDWPLARVYDAFPALRDRRRQSGAKLSGGEQQMLSIARVLRMGAQVLLLDEPTEGLAPVIVERIGEMLLAAKREGVTMLLVEQNLRFATRVADRHYLLAQGEVVERLANAEMIEREGELLRHLGM
ncbi:MAG TPA: ABC transporter ATP-binding protein [Candidatus Limnocylindria bacterium]|jgi:branched-chain amino acid transport system ATP-binding protein